MMNVLRRLLGAMALGVLGVVWAADDASVPTPDLTAPEPVQDQADAATVLDEWLVVGTFLHSPREENELAGYDLSPEGITGSASDAQLLKIAQLASAGVTALSLHQVESVNLGGLLKVPPRRAQRLSSAYLFSRFKTAAAAKVWIFVQNSQEMDLWVNGTKAGLWRKNRFYSGYEVPVEAGVNRLLLRVPDVGRVLPVAVRYSRGAPAAAFERCFAGALFPSVIWPQDADPKSLCSDLFADDARVESISPSAGADAPTAGPPLSTVKIKLGSETFTGVFFRQCGPTPNEYFRQRASKYLDADQHGPSVKALLRRLEILDAARQQTLDGAPRSLELNYRFRWTVTELQRAIEALDRGTEPFRLQPGMHLCGFVSKLDDQIQYYRVFVPTVQRDRPIPLAVLMTPALGRDVVFLESGIAAKQESADSVGEIAERLGVAVLWPGYRNNPCGSPVEFAHLDEVLGEVLAGWRIDRTRISLLGYSNAGITSCLAFTRNPKRYSAIGFNDPVLLQRSPHHREAHDVPVTADLMVEFSQTCRVPVHLYHDHSPDHGDFQESVLLAELFSSQDRNFVMRTDNHPTRSGEPQQLEEQLRFLTKPSRPDHDFSYTPNSSRTRTVAEAFAQRFIIVKPSRGLSEGGAKSVEAIVAAMTSNWSAASGSTPLIRTDAELTEREKLGANLILIGNGTVNLVWSEYRERLGVGLTADTLTLDGHTWTGPVSFQALMPHPANRTRSIVLIGATGDLSALFSPPNLPQEALYQAAVWDCTGQEPRWVFEKP